MPLNIQIQPRGDQYLFQGISQAGQSIGGALEQVINKYKRDQDQGKAADYFYKSLGDGAESMTGIHPEAWKTLGSKDKAQAMVGFMQSQTLKQLQAHVQEQQARAQTLQQNAQLQSDEAGAPAAYAQEWERAGQAPPPQPNPQELGPMGPMGLPALPGVPATDTPPWLQGDGTIATAPPTGVDRAMLAWSRMSKANPRFSAAMARIILPHVLGQATEGSLTPSYTEDPVTGARNITFGKQLQSTGFNPAKSAPQRIPMHDDDGNLTGWADVDIRGKSTYSPFRGNAKFPPATDPQGNPISGFYLDPNTGKPVDARTTIQKLSGGAAAQPTAANKDAIIQQAKDAIAKGADAAMVKQRLKQNYGIDLK